MLPVCRPQQHQPAPRYPFPLPQTLSPLAAPHSHTLPIATPEPFFPQNTPTCAPPFIDCFDIHGMQVITDAKEKDEALEALVEHIIPGDCIRRNNQVMQLQLR